MYTSIHKVTGKTQFSFPIRLFWPFFWGELHFSANGNRLTVMFSRTEIIGHYIIDPSILIENLQDKAIRNLTMRPTITSNQEMYFDRYVKMLVSGRILLSYNAYMNSLMKTKIELEKQRIKVQAEVEKFTI